MTAQLLANELSTLVQESKRKNADLRNAAEKSLNDLKALSNTSESQITADLSNRPNFVRPFLLACGTRNPKYATSAIICLQRLVVSQALPRASLKGALECFRESSSLGLEVQLKILQTLPFLLQNYAHELCGTLLGAVFQVCFLLYSSKTAVVSNTAAASLQQLVTLTYEKVAAEDDEVLDATPTRDVSVDNFALSVHTAAEDAFYILTDVCLLTEGRESQFLHAVTLSTTFGLELLESILANQMDIITDHTEQLYVLRSRLIPILVKILSDKSSFPIAVRAMRVLQLVISRFFSKLADDCETILSLLNRILDPDSGAIWKRALCLEVFVGFHADPSLVRRIFAHYDETGCRKNIIGDHLASLVRLAAENPEAIGLGQQSTIPAMRSAAIDDSGQQAAMQAGGLAGTMGAAISLSDAAGPGISTQMMMRIPCIEQLDKAEAPSIPPAYVYSLALTSVNSFSDGLARFLLPLTVPTESKTKRKTRPNKPDALEGSQETVQDDDTAGPASKESTDTPRQLPVNPLGLQHHVLYSEIQTSAHMIDQCWPALLAADSTFLNAALDTNFYHALIRSFQRFTQVAGLLDLRTPRDAFLTALSKHAVPRSSVEAYVIGSTIAGSRTSDKGGGRGSSLGPHNLQGRRQETAEPSQNRALDTRNLLCLRALINLGIALGPSLHDSWSIILLALRSASLVLLRSPSRSAGASDFGVELTAVQSATSRLFESTSKLPDDAFVDLLSSVHDLLNGVFEDRNGLSTNPANNSISIDSSRRHRRIPSFSSTSAGLADEAQSIAFVIEKLGDLIKANTIRLSQANITENGWSLILQILKEVLRSLIMGSELRLLAAKTINMLVTTVTSKYDCVGLDEQHEAMERGLRTLRKEIELLYSDELSATKDSRSCDIEIHRLSLDVLRSILENHGDSLVRGWSDIFRMINSIFRESANNHTNDTLGKAMNVSVKSSKIVRSSFGSLQLICSDYLNSVPKSCQIVLLDSLSSFSSQHQDFNISLTATTLYKNVSDFLQNENEPVKSGEEIMAPRIGHRFSTKSIEDEACPSTRATWLYLLRRLLFVSIDSRFEVRHNSLRTMFQIMEDCEDRLGPEDCYLCFQDVLVETLFFNESGYKASGESQMTDQLDDQARWNQSAIIITRELSRLFVRCVENLRAYAGFILLWEKLLEGFSNMLRRHDLEISTTVFSALSTILIGVGDYSEIPQAVLERTWILWQNNNPIFDTDNHGRPHNHEATLAYFGCLRQIIYPMKHKMDITMAEAILETVYSGTLNSSNPPYTSDIDNLSPVQLEALNTLKMIPQDIPSIVPQMLETIARFVAMAYEPRQTPNKANPTFLALSKEAMDIMRLYIELTIGRPNIKYQQALTRAVNALTVPLNLKYTWQKEGKNPQTWQKATSTALEIIGISIPVAQTFGDTLGNTDSFWKATAKIGEGIIAADCSERKDMSQMQIDEAFDINAFQKFQALVLPVIGASYVRDEVRHKYVASIFRYSLIHDPHPDDIPTDDQEPLATLRSAHIGRTNDLPPTIRRRMSYVLLDELFGMVAVDNGSPERIKLSQAAAPYLLLRAGVTLKAYILDQPLRGRMPQPRSQKCEMLYILRKLVKLECEPKATADTMGMDFDRKAHLRCLYPLVMRALEAAWRDEIMMRALREVLNAMGEGLGI